MSAKSKIPVYVYKEAMYALRHQGYRATLDEEYRGRGMEHETIGIATDAPMPAVVLALNEAAEAHDIDSKVFRNLNQDSLGFDAIFYLS